MQPAIHWFRRDLRLGDNPALHAASEASGGQVLPLFILDDTILRAPDTSAARVAFLLDSLGALDRALRERGSRLILRRGQPAAVLCELAEAIGARLLCFNRDYAPFALARDAAVQQALAERGVEMRGFNDTTLVEPSVLRTKAGGWYTVFTPYLRQWRARVAAEPPPPDRRLPGWAPLPAPIVSLAIPTLAELGYATSQALPPGGEAAGQARLAAFVRPDNPQGIGGYQHGRERPALAATSQLGPYLRFGCLAPLACLRAALHCAAERRAQMLEGRVTQSDMDRSLVSIDTWVSELAWRDFYHQILAHFPHVLDGAFKPMYDALAWENDRRLFEAWCAGRTGYPIVDAAMRQLNQEAWMHNRARMIVASFLTKDLLIDWRWGERYFMRQLADGDHAANNGGWQWAAGTGTDPQPYFRIFNPASQGQKFDPSGAYVRRYVPELAHLPDRYIHTPWAMPEAEQRRIGRDYPGPIVDHATRREQALAMYRAVRAAHQASRSEADSAA